MPPLCREIYLFMEVRDKLPLRLFRREEHLRRLNWTWTYP